MEPQRTPWPCAERGTLAPACLSSVSCPRPDSPALSISEHRIFHVLSPRFQLCLHRRHFYFHAALLCDPRGSFPPLSPLEARAHTIPADRCPPCALPAVPAARALAGLPLTLTQCRTFLAHRLLIKGVFGFQAIEGLPVASLDRFPVGVHYCWRASSEWLQFVSSSVTAPDVDIPRPCPETSGWLAFSSPSEFSETCSIDAVQGFICT